MTEEEAKKFVSEVNLALAQIDQLAAELHKQLELVATQFANLVDVFNN